MRLSNRSSSAGGTGGAGMSGSSRVGRARSTFTPLRLLLLLVVILVAALVGGYLYLRGGGDNDGRNARVWDWLRNPGTHPEWAVLAGERCGSAPFVMPTDGFIGFLWDDSFRVGHRHTGIDIFGGGESGVTPVVAAHDGYLTRLPEWKSTVIIRIPQDPLQPDRQIWTYYTHLAAPDGTPFISGEFPPGTYEKAIAAGTFLGYQGNYSGTPGSPTGVHLHFSIVLDDGSGQFLNELEIENTLDPSPYLGLQLNANQAGEGAPVCPQ